MRGSRSADNHDSIAANIFVFLRLTLGSSIFRSLTLALLEEIEMGSWMILVLLAVFIIGSRLIAEGMDQQRIAAYLRRKGAKLISCRYAPFGHGWFGEKGDRIYKLRYRDRAGSLHQATSKTSMFSGVYFTEDEIIEPAGNGRFFANETALEQENAYLRQRIAELEARDSGRNANE